MVRSWLLVSMLVGLGGCWASAEFECQQASDCVSASGGGTCQADGFCSFPSEDCPSGQRYGDHSGPSGGQCVPPDDAAPTTSASTSTTADATSVASLDVTGSSMPTDGVDMQTTGTTEPVTTATTGRAGTTGAPGSTSDATGSSSTGTGEPLDPDLVLWLQLDGLEGSVAADASMYEHGGTCDGTACPTTSTGALSDAAVFDGVDDSIAVPSAPHLLTPDGLTASCWIRIEAMPTEHQAVLTKPLDGDNFNSFEIYFFGSPTATLRFGMAVDVDESDTVVVAQDLPLGEWVHVAGTWDGAELGIWLDGALIATMPHTVYASSTSPVFVGADDDSDPTGLEGFFEGGLDDVRLYSRALSSDEIAALAAGRD